MKITYQIYSIEDTKKLAEMLAPQILGKIILLKGEIGVGKTAFSGFFINAICNTPINVTSPTFPIVQSYKTSSGVVHHIDLYRINNETELQNLGLDELLADTCLIEWCEKLGNYNPKHFIKITILTIDENAREIQIEFSKKYENLYEEIKKIHVI